MLKRFMALLCILLIVMTVTGGFIYFIPKARASGTSSVGISLSGGPDKNMSYIGNEIDVKIKLTPWGSINELSRAPVSVVIVIDSSGSMNQANKMNAAKDAAKNLIDSFKNSAKSGDKLGVVDFDSFVNDGSRYYLKNGGSVSGPHQTSNCSSPMLVDLTNTSAVNTLKTYVDNMTASGGTNMEAALNKAKALLDSSPPGNSKYVIFITDGMPTAYVNGTYNGYPLVETQNWQMNDTTKSETLSAVQSLSQSGAKLFVVGVDTTGAEIDINFINLMARVGNGMSYYVSNVNALNSILQNIFRIINSNTTVTYNNLTMEYPIPSGIRVSSIPPGWRVENGKLIGTFSPVTFENGGGTPAVQEISFKITSNAEGIYNLGKATLTFRKRDSVGESTGSLEVDLGQVEFARQPGISATFQILGSSNMFVTNTPYDAKLTINAYGKSLDVDTVIGNFELLVNNTDISLQKITTTNPSLYYPINSGPASTSLTIDYKITFMKEGNILFTPVLSYSINSTANSMNLTPLNLFVIDLANMIKNFTITKKIISDNSSANLILKVDDRGLFDYDSTAKINIFIEMSPTDTLNTNERFPLQLVIDNSTRKSNGLRFLVKTITFKLKPNLKSTKINFNISRIDVLIGGVTYTTAFERRINNVVVKKATLR